MAVAHRLWRARDLDRDGAAKASASVCCCHAEISFSVRSGQSEPLTYRAKLGLVQTLGLDEPDRPADGQRLTQGSVHRAQWRIGGHTERLDDLRKKSARPLP